LQSCFRKVIRQEANSCRYIAPSEIAWRSAGRRAKDFLSQAAHKFSQRAGNQLALLIRELNAYAITFAH
jgi:hypothetical protein